MSDETALAYRQAQQEYRQALTGGQADPGPLLEAARAHLKASRALDEVRAEYGELQAARWERGETVDEARYHALAAELAPLAEATQNLAGNLPGSGHGATAGIGD